MLCTVPIILASSADRISGALRNFAIAHTAYRFCVHFAAWRDDERQQEKTSCAMRMMPAICLTGFGNPLILKSMQEAGPSRPLRLGAPAEDGGRNDPSKM